MLLKTPKFSFFACLLFIIVLSSFANAQNQRRVDFPKQVSLKIDRNPAWGYNDDNGIEEGSRISIRCTFQNTGKTAVSFLLADHDAYHGTMIYPFFMSARVTNSNGKVITRTKDFGDWWTNYYLWSQSYKEMPGDRIILKPKEKVIRVVPLRSVLVGLENLPEGLNAGEYGVELKLGEIVSNKLQLKIVPKGE